MSRLAVVVLLAAALAAADPPPRPATHELGDGTWSVLVALPDAQHPWFTRQLRFDWSGLVVHARWKDTVLIGSPAKDGGLPGLSLGTSDEFTEALAVDGADPAGPLVKLGVGVLVSEPAVGRRKPKRILAQAALNRATVAAGSVEFVQELDPAQAGGIGWRLEKRVELLPAGAGFRIARRLRNTGARTLASPWYCHHWFRPGGGGRTGTTVTWPFTPTIELAKGPDSAALLGGTLTLKTWPGAFYATITGFRSAADNGAVVRQPDGSVGFAWSGDWMPVKHALYVHGDICPEPFHAIDLEPGREMAWATTYSVDNPQR